MYINLFFILKSVHNFQNSIKKKLEVDDTAPKTLPVVPHC